MARRVYRATLDCGTVKYHTIQLLACVLSGLFRYQEAAVVRIVDGAIEAFRCAIERNDYREGQMRAHSPGSSGSFLGTLTQGR